MMNVFEDFIKVNKKDPRVQNNINIMLDRYMKLPYDFQSRIKHHSCLISSNLFKRMIY